MINDAVTAIPMLIRARIGEGKTIRAYLVDSPEQVQAHRERVHELLEPTIEEKISKTLILKTSFGQPLIADATKLLNRRLRDKNNARIAAVLSKILWI